MTNPSKPDNLGDSTTNSNLTVVSAGQISIQMDEEENGDEDDTQDTYL